MIEYTRDDMVYDDYSWTVEETGDMPDFIISNGKDMLNRREGYEVLHFLNSIARNARWTRIEHCKKIERMIREHVPPEIISRLDILKWCTDYWSDLKRKSYPVL